MIYYVQDNNFTQAIGIQKSRTTHSQVNVKKERNVTYRTVKLIKLYLNEKTFDNTMFF